MSGLTEHQIWYRRLLRKRSYTGTFNPDAALRIAGRRDEIHPADVVALVCATRNDALLHSRANREAYGHDIVTSATPVEGVGWLIVVDLRRSLQELGAGVADAGTPYSGWNHGGVWHRKGATCWQRPVSGAPAPAADRRSPPATGPADADGTPHTAPPHDPTDPTPG